MQPIALYLHIPFCARKCNYCDFASVAGRMELLPAYLSMLRQELQQQAALWPSRAVRTIFLGGGTPSLLPAEAYRPLLEAIRSAFQIEEDAEISLEANPGTLNRDKADAMREAGFNRVSLGVQASQDRLLEKMGRIHRAADAEQAMRSLLDAGFRNLNIDLMFGLPGQTLADWQESLRFAFSFPLSHLSFYSLSMEEGTPWGDLYAKKQLEPASDELDRRMYHEARNVLERHGFAHYELSNAARPGLWCRHNLIYWNRGDYLGVGAGAHSLMENLRFANVVDPAEYIERMRRGMSPVFETQRLSCGDVLSERLFMGLRLLRGVDLRQVSRETGLDVEGRYAEDIVNLAREGLVTCSDSVLKLTTHGLDFANTVFRVFV